MNIYACGCVFPGRSARGINARIRYIPTTDVTVLAAGTNNIETRTIAECSKEIQQTIDNVAHKRHHKAVIMSQLPHRFEKPKLNSNRKYKDYVYRKMLVQEYIEKRKRILKKVKPKNNLMYQDIYNCICQNIKK